MTDELEQIVSNAYIYVERCRCPNCFGRYNTNSMIIQTNAMSLRSNTMHKSDGQPKNLTLKFKAAMLLNKDLKIVKGCKLVLICSRCNQKKQMTFEKDV